jgi:hypothetical protein
MAVRRLLPRGAKFRATGAKITLLQRIARRKRQVMPALNRAVNVPSAVMVASRGGPPAPGSVIEWHLGPVATAVRHPAARARPLRRQILAAKDVGC